MWFWFIACGKGLDAGDSGFPDSFDSGIVPLSEWLPPVVEGNADDFYADSAPMDIRLSIDAAGIEALREEPRTWVAGAMYWEGAWYGPVGIRIKGEQSYRSIDGKPSLKIKFSEYQDDGRFFGMRRLVFNNMISDDSMMRERLAYRVFREYGSPAPRCNHVNVYLNDTLYGLYANVENTDEELLSEWFDNDEGSMWEIHDADFREGLTAGFELEEGIDDRTQIEALTVALTEPNATTRMFEYVDKTEWYKYFPVMAYIGNLDGYPFSDPGDDSHLFLNPETGKFQFIPHGLDETFLDDASVEFVMHGILATACIDEDGACKEEWRAALQAVIDFVPQLDLLNSVDQIADQIAPSMTADTRREFTEAEIDAGQAYLREFINLRSPDLEEQLTW